MQLLEKYGKLDFDGLRYMAEELEGSFTITVLSDKELYFVKGNNPMCIYHYPDKGLYVYTSTEEILRKAMLKAKLPLGRSEKIRAQFAALREMLNLPTGLWRWAEIRHFAHAGTCEQLRTTY